jgi:hypothetical protein
MGRIFSFLMTLFARWLRGGVCPLHWENPVSKGRCPIAYGFPKNRLLASIGGEGKEALFSHRCPLSGRLMNACTFHRPQTNVL